MNKIATSSLTAIINILISILFTSLLLIVVQTQDLAHEEVALDRIMEAANSDTMRLDLSGLNLTTLPSEIGLLTKLEWLSLADNALTKIPPEIGQLTSLYVLDLSGNNLAELPVEIEQLTSLQEIRLSDNPLPRSLSLMSSTNIGAIVNYVIEHQDVATRAHVTVMTAAQSSSDELWLSGLGITTIPNALWDLTKINVLDLKILDLRNNELTVLPSDISLLSSLQVLGLDNNFIDKLPSEIGQLSDLEFLTLSNNELTEIPPEIGLLTNLRQLDLSYNDLEELPSELISLTNLLELDLRGNPLPSELLVTARSDVEGIMEYLRNHQTNELTSDPINFSEILVENLFVRYECMFYDSQQGSFPCNDRADIFLILISFSPDGTLDYRFESENGSKVNLSISNWEYDQSDPVYLPWILPLDGRTIDYTEGGYSTSSSTVTNSAYGLLPAGIESIYINNSSLEVMKYDGQFVQEITANSDCCDITHEIKLSRYYDLRTGILIRHETEISQSECKPASHTDCPEFLRPLTIVTDLTQTNQPMSFLGNE